MNLDIKKLKEAISKTGITVQDEASPTHIRMIPDSFCYTDIATYIEDMGKKNFAFSRQQSLTGMDGVIYTVLHFSVW